MDYLSRFPTFEAPRPSSFDEQYVVKCINRFFDACEFLDEWAKCCPAIEDPPIIQKNSQSSAVSNTINLIESLDSGQHRVYCSDKDNSIAVSHTFGNLSVEGILIQNIPVTSNGITSVEGDENLVINHTGTFRQFTTFDISPLGGFKFAGLKFNQSALREKQHAFVTFSAWITHYLPILISLWFISLVVSDCDILLSLIEFFAFVSSDRISWITIVLLGVFHFQTAMDSNTGANNNNTNDSFEQLLNHYLPVTQP